MKNNLWALAFLFGSFAFAQNSGNIKIEPENFKNTVALQVDLKEKTDLNICFFEGKKKIKTVSFNEANKGFYKIDLKDLPQNKTYTVKVINAKNEVLYTTEITKSLKY